MSVNAINAAEVQQPKKNNSSAAIGAGVALGAAGATAGYFHKATPELEKVFEQEPDTFNGTYEKLKAKDVTAAGTIQTEYNALQTAIKPQTDALTAAEDAMKAHINGITDYDNKATLEQAVTEKKNALNAKEVEVPKADGTEGTRNIKYTDARSEFDAAKNGVNNLAADAAEDVKTAAKNKLEAAKANLAKFDAEANAVEEAEKAVFDAKKVKFDAAAAAESSTEANLKKAVSEATDKLRTAKEEAIGKLKDKTNLKEAYQNVKKALAEVKWSRVGIYGGIAAAVGLLAGAMLGGKKEAPQEAQQA